MLTCGLRARRRPAGLRHRAGSANASELINSP
jgi:hypothetical protein